MPLPACAEARRLGSGVVLRDDRLIDETFDRSWKLNESGRLVVSCVARGWEADRIVERLAQSLAVEPGRVHRDVEHMLVSLERRRLLEGRRRSAAVTFHRVQQAILRQPVIFAVQLALIRAFDWYFGILRRVLGSTHS